MSTRRNGNWSILPRCPRRCDGLLGIVTTTTIKGKAAMPSPSSLRYCAMYSLIALSTISPMGTPISKHSYASSGKSYIHLVHFF